jgi:hypothetical protein
MKIKLPIMFAIALLSTVMVKGEEPAKQLADSLAKWNETKRCNGDNYSYQVSTSSFTGSRTVTTITVEEGRVTKREYSEIEVSMAPTPPGDKQTEPVGYVEVGDDVGKDKRGAAAKTLDELYAEAKKVLEPPLGEHEKLYFKSDEKVLLLHCFKVDTRIADDAPIHGVMISNLQLH